MKNIYLGIKSRLETDVTQLQTVRLFNNQFERSNNDNSDLNDEQAFAYPCCFIEFINDAPMISQGAGAKRLEVEVRLHIGFESYELEDLDIFDLVESIQVALDGYSTIYFSPLTYLAQRTDYNHNNIYIYQLEYSCIYEDSSSYIKNNTITKNAPHTLSVTIDLDIDNDIIRTGDGT